MNRKLRDRVQEYFSKIRSAIDTDNQEEFLELLNDNEIKELIAENTLRSYIYIDYLTKAFNKWLVR